MLASGRVRYAGVVWDICTTVSRAAPDDRLRVGLPGESEASKLARFTASERAPWTKYNWKPTPRERRALLRLVDAELANVVPVVRCSDILFLRFLLRFGYMYIWTRL
jgi:hypothetical protein